MKLTPNGLSVSERTCSSRSASVMAVSLPPGGTEHSQSTGLRHRRRQCWWRCRAHACLLDWHSAANQPAA